VNQVFAADLIQGIEDSNLEIVNVAPQLVLTDPDGLVAVGPELLKDQIMDFRPGFAAGTHLVDWHSQAPGSDTAEEGMVLNQESVGASCRGTERSADSGRAATDNQYIRLVWNGGLFADCQGTSGRS
jgi:hypothetical protein